LAGAAIDDPEPVFIDEGCMIDSAWDGFTGTIRPNMDDGTRTRDDAVIPTRLVGREPVLF